MSIRNDYLNAISRIRSGAIGGIAGGLVLVALAFLETPPNPLLIVGGVLLAIDALWVRRTPTSKAVLPLCVGLLIVAVALLRDPLEGGRLPGAILMLGMGGRVASSYWQLTNEGLARALSAPRSAEEIAEERLEDLVEEISTSTMESDHHRIEFVAADFWRRFRCEARLRKSNVVLISRRDGTYLAPTPTYAVIPKADFEVTAVRKRWFRHSMPDSSAH